MGRDSGAITSQLELLVQSDLYVQLLRQLEKDFIRANIDFHIAEATSPKDLIMLVREKCYVLLMERFEEFLNLMYAVDVPEWDLAALTPEDPVEGATQAAFLVLKRECQKVLLRNGR